MFLFIIAQSDAHPPFARGSCPIFLKTLNVVSVFQFVRVPVSPIVGFSGCSGSETTHFVRAFPEQCLLDGIGIVINVLLEWLTQMGP